MKSNKRSSNIVAYFIFIFASLFSATIYAQTIVNPGEQVDLDAPTQGGSDEDCSLSQCFSSFSTSGKILRVHAQIPVGIADMTNSANAFLTQRFTLSAGSSTGRILNADLNGSAQVKGEVFTAAGIAGLNANVSVIVSLFDETDSRSVFSRQIFSDDCTSNFGFDFCRSNTNGAENLNQSIKLSRGHTYSLKLFAECEASSGIIGDLAICDFSQALTGDDFVRWNNFSLTVEPDIVELLENIQSSIDVLDGKVDVLQMTVDDLRGEVDVIKERQLEEIRLLHTPQGRRSTDVPACNGNACDFPEK